MFFCFVCYFFLLLLYVGLIFALAYGLFFWFANQRDLTSFSSLGFLTPVFALATGGWLLGERLDLLQWIGVVMVLVSVIFVSQRRRFWEPLPLADPSS